MNIKTVAGLLVVGFAATACEHSEPAMSPASDTSNASRTVEAITMARCDHAQRCGEIGSTATYADRDHCVTKERLDAQRALGSCSEGVDNEDAQECLAEINNEDCSGPLDRLEQLKECSTDDLCDGN